MAAQRSCCRDLLRYEYGMRRDTQTTFENINRAQAQEFVSRRTMLRFFAEFRAENIDLEDQLRSRCSREVGRKTVIESIEENPTLLWGC
ncbi:hypothetical protein KIN20_014537 [Parelaphostrongylus tenuis]|uniref:Mos1 transposase HTH domain-containing protein n=1 Tax=Parelaphostrongylus tenuis TaxID=148309 RepID=A0AAD5MII2_PARTN|nr:hypothetical protein KIN20_014537 [Parelaphostrongylus tenuis]